MTTTLETIALVASGPVGLGVGAALLKSWQEWSKRRELREDKRLELDHQEEVARIEADRQARLEETKARIAEAEAEESTGQHLLAVERGERTEKELWKRLERVEKDNRGLRTDVDECKEQHGRTLAREAAALHRERACEERIARVESEATESIQELRDQVERQDSALNVISGSLPPAERRAVRKTISGSAHPARSGEDTPANLDTAVEPAPPKPPKVPR